MYDSDDTYYSDDDDEDDDDDLDNESLHNVASNLRRKYEKRSTDKSSGKGSWVFSFWTTDLGFVFVLLEELTPCVSH